MAPAAAATAAAAAATSTRRSADYLPGEVLIYTLVVPICFFGILAAIYFITKIVQEYRRQMFRKKYGNNIWIGSMKRHDPPRRSVLMLYTDLKAKILRAKRAAQDPEAAAAAATPQHLSAAFQNVRPAQWTDEEFDIRLDAITLEAQRVLADAQKVLKEDAPPKTTTETAAETAWPSQRALGGLFERVDDLSLTRGPWSTRRSRLHETTDGTFEELDGDGIDGITTPPPAYFE